jgi:hypothetical protein
LFELAYAKEKTLTLHRSTGRICLNLLVLHPQGLGIYTNLLCNGSTHPSCLLPHPLISPFLAGEK